MDKGKGEAPDPHGANTDPNPIAKPNLIANYADGCGSTDCVITVNRKYSQSMEYIFSRVILRYTAIHKAGRVDRHILTKIVKPARRGFTGLAHS